MGCERESKKRATPTKASKEVKSSTNINAREKKRKTEVEVIRKTGNEESFDIVEDRGIKLRHGCTGLKYLYTNADQLLNKIEDLKMMIAGDEPDLMMITEVIPKAQKNPISDVQLKIDGYKVYKNFKNDEYDLGASGMRGVALYVKSDLQSNEITHEIIDEHKDQVWIEIDLVGKDKLLCGCMYRSPSNDKNISSVSSRLISQSIRKANERKPTHILITGDFNFKEIDWENEFIEGTHHDKYSDGIKSGGNQHISMFIDTLQDLFLKQHVTEPTRYRNGEEPSILDLIITNEVGMVQNLSYLPALGDSDHCCLRFDLNCYAQHYKVKRVETPNYYSADYASIRSRLSRIDWEEVLTGKISENYQAFIEHLNSTTKGCVPNRISPKKKKNLYMTTDALRLKNKKNRLWKRYVQTKSLYDHLAFTQCKNKLRKLTRNLRTRYETSIANAIKNKPKVFWRYVNSKLKTRETIPSLKNADGSISVTPREKAESLNSYFSSVFVNEDLANVPDILGNHTEDTLESIDFSEDKVLVKLQQLNPNKSPGPDGWHPYYLRELANELSKPLSMLFKQSLVEMVVPKDWLRALITAIHKKGSKDIMGNYRPVSLTSVLCKIFESIIRESVIEHMVRNGIIAEEQHGFVPNRNCMTNLLTAVEDWSSMIEKGMTFDLIYTDFAKAFDSVPHARLITKLKSVGIRGDLLGWIEAFLTNRTQRVFVDGESSKCTDVISGIPQGSVLGPLLFVIFINDMPQNILSECKMFADDAKIYKEMNSEEDCIALQNDLDIMTEWSRKWQLPFNEGKCKRMHFGKGNLKKKYKMNEHVLEEVHHEKDLGVIIDTSLKFHKHTAAAIKRANSVLGIIKKSFIALDARTLTLLYKSMVRPHLEYGNVIWGPYYKGDKQLIEKVQKRATKIIPGIRHLPYVQRLKKLKLPSLVYRRRRGDMLETYKIVTRKVNVKTEHFFKFNVRESRGHQFKLRKHQTSKKLVRSQCFSNRVINDWNSLPREVVESETVNEFKKKLDDHWNGQQYETPFV